MKGSKFSLPCNLPLAHGTMHIHGAAYSVWLPAAVAQLELNARCPKTHDYNLVFGVEKGRKETDVMWVFVSSLPVLISSEFHFQEHFRSLLMAMC